MSVEFGETERTFYPLQAKTLMAAADIISREDEAAKAEWFPRYDYETTNDQLSTANVTVDTRITMPEWSDYCLAGQRERDEWDRFFAALQTHEQGHLDLVSQAFANVDEQLVGKSVKGAARAWQSVLDALSRASRAYDDQTDHGRDQGAVIDVSMSENP